MKPLYLLLICLFCASCSTINQNRQDCEYQSNFEKKLPNFKYPDTTKSIRTSANYETYLNKEFFNQCQDCNIIKSIYPYNPSKSYIPNRLQRNIPQSNRVLGIDYNMSDLLLCYFTNDTALDIENISNMKFNKLDALMRNIEPLVDSRMRQNFTYYQYDFKPSYIYTRSCSGYLNALLEMGIKPPMSSIESTLTAEEQNNSVITILYGTYTSALANLLTERGNPLSNYLYFKLYDVYNKNNDNTLYYLKSFTGMSYNRITDQNTIRNLASKIGLNVSLPIPQAMTSISSNVNIKTVLENKEYFFGAFPKTLIDFSQNLKIDSLPDKKAVEKAIESIEVTPTKTIKPVYQGRVYTYEFEIKGVPTNRCYHSNWDIKLDTNAIFENENEVRFDIEGKRALFETDSINVCRFKVYLTPKKNVNQIPDDKEVTFNINYKIGGNLTIKHQVLIPVSEYPTVEVVDPTVVLQPALKNLENGQKRIKWDGLKISVKKSASNPVKTDKFTVTEAYCILDPNDPNSKIEFVASKPSTDRDNISQINLYTQQMYQVDATPLTALKTAKGILKIKIKDNSNKEVERSVEFNIIIPNQLSK